jgi:hypothetical protein
MDLQEKFGEQEIGASATKGYCAATVQQRILPISASHGASGITHYPLSISRPHFLLNQRTNLDVLNIEVSTAKLVTVAFRGKFGGIGNASPQNVNRTIAPHRPRRDGLWH